MNQYISFGPSAGICNRIKRLFSALRFNVDLSKPLDFYWSTCALTNHAFYELFEFDMYRFNEISCTTKVVIDGEHDVASDIVWRLNIDSEELPKGFTKAFKKDDESKEYIDFEYNRIPKKIIDIYMPYFDALKPSEFVKSRINEVSIPENCVGVHIRQDRFWNEYGRGNRHSVEAYIETMKMYSGDTVFFLASASKTVSEKAKDIFGNRIIELPNKNFTDAIDAVAELYLLGMTSELVATYGSTFSEVAWWLGGCKQKVTVVGSENDWGIKCPICGGEARTIRKYSKDDIIKSYKHLYEEVPENLDLVDYEMMKCTDCSLVFSNPMEAGNQSFYTWVTGHENYYPTVDAPRWEWGEVRDYIERNNTKSLLEVGCGTGEFLDYLRRKVNIDAVGLDTTTSSYNACIEKGLKAYNEALEEYVSECNTKYDLVVAFHLLEHVENPFELVSDMMKILSDNGKCILSFPYSDLRIDKCFTTANNMPPHHLTRWELPAIKALADGVGAKYELVAPESNAVKQDIFNDLRNEYFPIYMNMNISKKRVLGEALKHLSRTVEIIRCEKTRTNIDLSYHIGGKTVERRPPWFVLAVFEKGKMET